MLEGQLSALPTTSGESRNENEVNLLKSAGRVAALALLLIAAGACGDDNEIFPNPEACPKSPPTTGSVCPSELLQKACYWDDLDAKLRTWCHCPAGFAWTCFDDQL
jgi:hypothetical protein